MPDWRVNKNANMLYTTNEIIERKMIFMQQTLIV